MAILKKYPLACAVAVHSMIILFGSSCSRSDNMYGLPEVGKVAAKTSRMIQESYWGIQASTLDPALLERMTEIGVKWTRLNANWSSIEKSRGIYDWENTDAAFQTTLASSIVPFVTLGGGHPLYTPLSTYEDPRLAEIYGYKPGPPTLSDSAMRGWLNFTEATVTRYKDVITHWEIWNEPNHRNYWGGPPDPVAYGTLVRETAQLIKSIQPDAKIIAGSLAGLDPEFIRVFLDQGTHTFVDIVSYHNYGAIPEERIYAATEAWKVINSYKPGIQLWQGECGYPSHSSTRDYRGISPWGLNIQSKWLLRQAFTDIYFCKATMSNYFKLAHERGYGEVPERTNLTPLDSILGYPERGGSRVKTVGVNEKCLLTNPGFDPKPAFHVYRNLCAVLDKRFMPVDAKHHLEVIDEGQFYGIGPFDDAFPSQPLVAKFKNQEGHHIIAYWLPWHPQEYLKSPAKIRLELPGINFQDPVLVDLLDGRAYELQDLEELPMVDYPLILADRSALHLE